MLNINEINLQRENENDVSKKRIEKLLDVGSFVEINSFTNNSNVKTGYGTIDGKLVFVYCQYGSITNLHARKICNIYKMAVQMGSPIIGILDSNGVQINEGINIFESYGELFKTISYSKKIIPHINLILGNCIGIDSLITGFSDFVFLSEKNGKLLFQTSNTFKDSKSITPENNNLVNMQKEKNSLVDFYLKDDDECFNSVRNFIKYIPSNNLESATETINSDNLNRTDNLLNNIIVDESSLIDVNTIINSIVDNNCFIEIKKEFAKNIIIGFGKFNGITTGIVANNGKLENLCIEKIIKFIDYCNDFNIPILNLTDVCGYEIKSIDEFRIIQNNAKLIQSYKNANVPKINIILRNGIGNGFITLNSIYIGADVVLAWPSAKISLIDEEAAKTILDLEINTSLFIAAENCHIQDIIEPSTTRKIIINSLEMLFSKRIKQD